MLNFSIIPETSIKDFLKALIFLLLVWKYMTYDFRFDTMSNRTYRFVRSVKLGMINKYFDS